ncbi:glycoside hydrolase family protein [Saccharicrinis fermentans]|uniref:Beta-xylosidase n=1 Tax=Saccharicrinis fermentans DSM 9555 = JCM 21142 TaxID=869213 RepID=W7YB59_9BACT|nr:glycoside hydrolase family protein [Saccharicrinis fermentans]GAF01616.1 beta-xylosidase [Saccharicrinis fermentans DSM 9555 = JCM 21142]
MKIQQIAILGLLIVVGWGCTTPTNKMKLEYIGVAAENKGMHVWGSSPVMDKEGRVHLYAAQWPMNTQPNFSGWFKDCEIGHYVSDSPEGPFEYVGVAVADRDSLFNSPHNPTIHYMDGRYVLCFIVNENSKLKTQRIVMYVADDLSDNWRPASGAEPDGTILRKPQDSTLWNYKAKLGVSNPSLIKHNGKYLLYHKSVIPKQPKGSAYTYGVAVADNVEGPYTIFPQKVTPPKMQLEDAYAFAMNDSVYLMSRDFVGSLGNSGGGLLWQSKDGFYFDSKNTKRAYEDLAHYLGEEYLKDATAYRGKKHGHLERAQLLFIDDKPAYLYLATGVQVKPGYGSSSHVFKISFE